MLQGGTVRGFRHPWRRGRYPCRQGRHRHGASAMKGNHLSGRLRRCSGVGTRATCITHTSLARLSEEAAAPSSRRWFALWFVYTFSQHTGPRGQRRAETLGNCWETRMTGHTV